jgi:hypothetical protein
MAYASRECAVVIQGTPLMTARYLWSVETLALHTGSVECMAITLFPVANVVTPRKHRSSKQETTHLGTVQLDQEPLLVPGIALAMGVATSLAFATAFLAILAMIALCILLLVQKIVVAMEDATTEDANVCQVGEAKIAAPAVA